MRRNFPFEPCSCYDRNATRRLIMDDIVDVYHGILREIYERHKANPGVVYTPANIDFLHYTLEEALSNVHRFHPTLVAQQWLAKSLWNDMFLPQSKKLSLWTFDPDKLVWIMMGLCRKHVLLTTSHRSIVLRRIRLD
ncbi:hypothetical protein BX666DRAFT_661350 [Dichotomocladium elegans]|nr:hypothetical protein BX666DRAFT_661350 [Dichotomocladium elegans]